MKLRHILTSGLVLAGMAAGAQQFGGFPPSVRWQQIRTDTARIIFAPAATAQGQRVAGIIHRMAATEGPAHTRLRRIPIVLHNNTTLANGYVSLAPFRSEYYLVPGSNIFEFGNLPWTEQLAIHEYRHVQQYNRFNRGLSKFAGILLGQEGRSLFNALAVPDWYFEGDAVHAETIFSPQGRGRQPWFFNNFQALWKEGRQYSWMKLRNGSYRDLVPNHYPLGYLLVNYGREKYGADFWTRVTDDASAFRGVFFPFQQAVRRQSGQRFSVFRKEALGNYEHQVSRRRDDQVRRETVINYQFPIQAGGDTLLYLKDGFKAIPGIYRRTASGESRIALRSISNDDWLQYHDGMVAYTAYSTHPRWSLIDYSDIVLLDTRTGREERITHKGKFFTPAFSPDGQRLVAVRINDSLQSELVILDRKGNVLQTRRTAAGALFVHPQFLDDQNIVVGIRHGSARISLHQLDLNTLKFAQLLPSTAATIGFFQPVKGKIYFTASLNGTDDLYELDTETKVTLRLTTGGVGHYYPNVRNGRVIWSEYTANGFRIRSEDLGKMNRVQVPVGQWGLPQTPFPVAGGDSAQNLLDAPQGEYPVTRYKGGSGLINVHSWRPYYEDPEFTFSVFSDNVLNTFSNELYYRYNLNETSHAVGFSTSYGGLYPVLSAGAEYVFGRSFFDTAGRRQTFANSELRLGYSVPLNFTRGKTLKALRFGSDVVYNVALPTGATKDNYRSSSTVYLSHAVTWTQQLPRAQQQIYPRLGYALGFYGRHSLDQPARQFLGNATTYLPGLFRTHSLVLSGSVQTTNAVSVSSRYFSNRFANSRGYSDYYNPKMWRLSANYHLPLLYPETGIPNIVYFARLRGNVFFDNTRYFNAAGARVTDLRSVGGELHFDTRWWNQYAVTFFVRYSYLLDANRVGARSPHVWEFVVPVSIIPR